MKERDPGEQAVYFLALATDYDGTLVSGGKLSGATIDTLVRFRSTGRRVVLVTGRQLFDLRQVCPDLDLFDRVVAENGAVLLNPATGTERMLAPPPPKALVKRLRQLNVKPLSVGHSVVATWEPHSTSVLQTIRELGLELQIVFNKGAVMVLPPGVNKASGLLAALHELDLSPHNAVAVGDAENDHALIDCCGCGAAVADAVPSLKDHADVQLASGNAAGVVELCGLIVSDELGLARRSSAGIRLGVDEAGDEVAIYPYQGSLLITGPPGTGKSTLITAMTERMSAAGFEFFIFDPEGDYFGLQDAVAVGNALRPPDRGEAMKLLREVGVNLVLNTQHLGLGQRRALLRSTLIGTADLRLRTGRPHWVAVDEAHQVLVDHVWPELIANGVNPPSAILVTAYPEALPRPVLEQVEAVVTFDRDLSELGRILSRQPASVPRGPRPEIGEAVYWDLSSEAAPRLFIVDKPNQIHKRHKGKYAIGDVGYHRSFYFDDGRGCRARNLFEFIDLSDDVGDSCWTRHLRAHDFSAWFNEVIKDPQLAEQADAIESDERLGPHESRKLIKDAILSLYAGPTPVPRFK